MKFFMPLPFISRLATPTLVGYTCVSDLRGDARNVGAGLLLLPTALHAQAEKRIALLIGNRAYASVGVLKNPHNDNAAVGEALAKQGFEKAKRPARKRRRDPKRA